MEVKGQSLEGWIKSLPNGARLELRHIHGNMVLQCKDACQFYWIEGPPMPEEKKKRTVTLYRYTVIDKEKSNIWQSDWVWRKDMCGESYAYRHHAQLLKTETKEVEIEGE